MISEPTDRLTGLGSASPAWRFGREVARDGGEWSMEWLLKRNCSMAPEQLFGLFGGFCVVSLSIAGYFWSQGATFVMGFAWLELAALGFALVIYSRHATDHERIALRRGILEVQHTSGTKVETVKFSPEWVHVEPVSSDDSLIEVSGQGRRIEIGRFVRPELRHQLATELRLAVRAAQGWSKASLQRG
jgi:uncharacterized membrane protein